MVQHDYISKIINGYKILDSSGNSNIGIVIGDYSLSKHDVGESVRRERSIKTPKIETEIEDGAI